MAQAVPKAQSLTNRQCISSAANNPSNLTNRLSRITYGSPKDLLRGSHHSNAVCSVTFICSHFDQDLAVSLSAASS